MIQILSSEVVNQIAAGEVVERPAHLIKELIENSLDAGAANIEIRADHGGRLIEVTDDGHGMTAADLKICTYRHATSKIANSSDIFKLSTFGFRGEALASAAAISDLSICSRLKDTDFANRLQIQFGELGELAETGGQKGTKIIVDKLFNNVPARKKFLKSDSAEISQIRQVVKAMGLAYPNVGFRFHAGEKLEIFWPSQTELQRAEQILGQKLYAAEKTEGELKVRCYFTAPNNVGRTGRQIWLFAQNRWIQDRSLQAAVMEAYRSFLMHGEYPFALIKIELDPEEVDVNIHPTKSQVKFADPRSVFRIVHSCIRRTLEQAPWMEQVQAAQPKTKDTEGAAEKVVREVQNVQFEEPSFKRTQFSQKPSIMQQLKNYAPAKSAPESVQSPVNRWVKSQFEQDKSLVQKPGAWASLQILGQANLTYLICQNERSMIYVDQHAAHERVLYEKIRKAHERGEFEIQKFLIPLSLDMDESRCDAVFEKLEDLAKLGLSLERASLTNILITEAPTFIKESAIVHTLDVLATEICEKAESFLFERIVSDIFATLACHSAVRAGQALTLEQMRELLEQMDEENSSFCPHGRPVYVEYSFDKLESDFGRRV